MLHMRRIVAWIEPDLSDREIAGTVIRIMESLQPYDAKDARTDIPFRDSHDRHGLALIQEFLEQTANTGIGSAHFGNVYSYLTTFLWNFW